MVTPSKVPSDQWLAAVRAAAQRLASRLRYREATVADAAGASPLLPGWWRDGLATAAIFGDGLVALPAPSGEVFSRPVAFMNAAEISQTAGGEVVPLAWVDGGAMVALVHDVDERPVMLTAPDPRRRDPGASQIVASSLVAFLDSLIPQTLCRFVGPGGASATAELVGEASLLIERNGELSRRDFADEEELSDYVATFVADGVDAGMTAVACPAGLRRVIDAHSPARAALLPEARAEAAIHQLLASGDLELAGPPSEDELGEVLDSLIDDASRFLERNRRTMNPARAFAEWLSVHRLVEDVYADDDTVRAALSMAEPDTDIDSDGSAS